MSVLDDKMKELGLLRQTSAEPEVREFSEAEWADLHSRLEKAIETNDKTEASRIMHLIRGGKIIKKKVKKATGAIRAMWRKAAKKRKSYFKRYRKRAKKLLKKHAAKLARFFKRESTESVRFDKARYTLRVESVRPTDLAGQLRELVAISEATSSMGPSPYIEGFANLALSFQGFAERFETVAHGLIAEDDEDCDELLQFSEQLGTYATECANFVKGLEEMAGSGVHVNNPSIDAAFRTYFEALNDAQELYASMVEGDEDEDGSDPT